MAEQNTNPAPAANNAPPAGNQPPVSIPNQNQTQGDQQPANAGGDNGNGGEQVTVSLDEFNNLKRDAGRWTKRHDHGRDRRFTRKKQESRQTIPDDADPDLANAIKERDTKLSQLQSENLQLRVKDQVRGLLDDDAYKELPVAVKKAVARNPLGFANPNSQELEDILADIEDYLITETPTVPSSNNQGNAQPPQNNAGQPAQAGQQNNASNVDNIPPVNNSGPSPQSSAKEVDVAGLKGSRRSTKILKGIFKK